MSTINKLVYGDIVLTDDEIEDGEAYTALALLSDALEIGTLQVQLTIRDQAVGERLSAFRRNDKLLYYHRDALRGTYYIERVQRTGKYSYELKANDAVALLEQSTHYGGIYTGQTVAQVVADICNIPYLIQTRFAGVKLYGWLPIATRRDNLIQVLFAVGANTKVDQNGTLRIESLWDGVTAAIPEDRVLLGDSVGYSARVTEVSVLEHQYIPGSETVDLFDGTALEGDIIQFSEPVYDLSAEGFTVLESSANYARLSAGTGKLTGKKYVHTTRDVRAQVLPDDVPNVVEVTEATLVSLVNSSAVAQRLARYYACLDTLTHDIIHQGEAPGDVVAFEHPYGGAATGCIKDTAVALGSRPVATENVLVGYRPPGFEGTETLSQRVVLTGEGTWTVPEGVTEVTAVVIDGGEDGEDGADGQLGGQYSVQNNQGSNSVFVQRPSSGTNSGQTTATASVSSYGSGSKGEGGAGGKGGSPGRVLRATVKVSPGEQIPYRCGAARARGEDHTETTFGGITSASGSPSEQGYTDPTTGETYASAGVSGTAGGAGGEAGAAGEAVGGAEGGAPAEGGSTTRNASDNDAVSGWSASYTVTANIQIGSAGGGGAGGGSGDRDGTPGGAAALNGEISVTANASTGGGTAQSPAINGGAGGNGADGADAEHYGAGGNGAGGGGGNGVPGRGSVTCDTTVKGIVWSTLGGTGSGRTFYAYATARAMGTTSAAGKGGKGGKGAPGCVILYYGILRPIPSGPVRDKTGRLVLDRLGRRIIV